MLLGLRLVFGLKGPYYRVFIGFVCRVYVGFMSGYM